MKHVLALAGAVLLVGGCSGRGQDANGPANVAAALPPAAPVAPTPVTLTAADGVRVFGDDYAAAKPRALILLFHQAGSSAAEYATIAPRLVAMGYSALAIDQRSGGDLFGSNRTVAALGGSTDEMAAMADLRAALDWAGTKRLPVIVWGSSYSAALAFLLAAGSPGRVAALLAFSPDEYLPDHDAVHRAAARLAIPVFIDASNAKEAAAARSIDAALVHAPLHVVFAAAHGVHGSSTLNPARDPAGAAENWRAVVRFLRALRRG